MSSKFTEPRRVTVALKFNGKSVDKQLASYLESVTYTDVASNDSDQLDINLQNIGMEWMGKWYPHKGDKISGSATFVNWQAMNTEKKLSFGSFTLDDISFTGSPLSAKFGSVAVPNKEGFRVRERTKTWKNVTIRAIAKEIAGRYKLGLKYSGGSIRIKNVEQSDQTDCAFLFSICEDYGLAMKLYASSIAIYDQTALEKKAPVATLNLQSFDGGDWTFTDTLAGVYTGAHISYKSGKDDKEISVYVGYKAEKASGSRVLKINETADSLGDAKRKAAAQVNKSNQEATKLSGSIFPNPKICAGVTVNVTGMGKANGKYFVDQSKLEIGESGTKQSLEMHKCQKRLKGT